MWNVVLVHQNEVDDGERTGKTAAALVVAKRQKQCAATTASKAEKRQQKSSTLHNLDFQFFWVRLETQQWYLCMWDRIFCLQTRVNNTLEKNKMGSV